MSTLEAWGWVVALVFLLWCCFSHGLYEIRNKNIIKYHIQYP